MKKKTLFLLIFLALTGLVTDTYSVRPRGGRGGWGRGGRGWYRGGRGRGWGRGWRGRGWGWRGRGWWGPRVGVVWPVVWSTRYDKMYPDYLDRAGHSWWEVTNNTPYPISVANLRGGPSITIGSGETSHLGHPYCFSFSVQTQDGQVRQFRTQHHFINIGLDNRGNLIINTW
jgi:hypothetical protein